MIIPTKKLTFCTDLLILDNNLGNRKKIAEIMRMSKEELYSYFRQEDSSLNSTDSIEIKPFEQGLKVFYFHRDSEKPFKTRVYLNPDESESLR